MVLFPSSETSSTRGKRSQRSSRSKGWHSDTATVQAASAPSQGRLSFVTDSGLTAVPRALGWRAAYRSHHVHKKDHPKSCASLHIKRLSSPCLPKTALFDHVYL